ncbi:hypothetical protein MESS2_760146 [Mesorhizobium metallidurans STM 2683]|uniref:Uncharacterized protein n=1 Tax=Mesorhizobium metallidurans STM 2683 TaxID=1297569 RepID=M5EUD7_9HYPH|nr:hypothetical protein MESS2_760146 [Mesorhizobium metallidurans STM 2683]
MTAGWRSKFSYCLLFNPTDLRSARYNPVLEVLKGPNEVRDVQNIADILVDPGGRWNGATTRKRRVIPSWSAPPCTCSTPKKKRRSPVSPPSCRTHNAHLPRHCSG